jgi:NADPH2:quinone reductase
MGESPLESEDDMTIAIKLQRPGSPDMLHVSDWDPGEPGPDEVRIRQHAIGLNFIDVYQRIGLYGLEAPAIPGVEGAGVVEAVGANVHDLVVGQRVAYAGASGAYAAARLLPAWRAVALPEAISFAHAAATLLRGLTVRMLLARTYPVSRDSVLLVHAAAGGLGSLLTRVATRLGACVIATTGSSEKAERARENGARHVIVGRDADLEGEVARLTRNRGVDFAVDGIGGDMFARTLACVRRFGTVASIGQVAGPIPPLSVEDLGPLRSLTLARPSVMAFAAERETYGEAMHDVFAMIASGDAEPPTQTYPLAHAADAHRDLEAGRTAGAAVLIP